MHLQGDLVQLKEISIVTGTELKSKAMDHLVMSHGLRHENINPLIGKLSGDLFIRWLLYRCLVPPQSTQFTVLN